MGSEICTRDNFHEARDDACRVITNEHERSGLDAVIDGEMRREEMVEYFAHRVPGYKSNGLVEVWGHNYFDKSSIVDEIGYDEPWLVDELEFTNDVASKPVKMPITDPCTLASWSFNEHCDSEADLVYTLADLVNEEIEQLVEVGATYIQTDEPALTTAPDDRAIVDKCLERIAAGIPGGVRIGLRVCYGGYSHIYPELSDYPIDEFNMELCNGGYEQISVFTDPEFEPDLILDVVDVRTTEVKTIEEIKESIKRGLKVVPSGKLTVSPDCGVELLPREVAYQKVGNVVRATREIEAELDAGEIDLDVPIPQAD